MQSLGLAFGVMVMVVSSLLGADGRTVSELDTIVIPSDCPEPYRVNANGTCEIPQEVIEILTAPERRDNITLSSACPKCVEGTLQSYPNWSDCNRFVVCFSGRTFDFACSEIPGVLFFNPTTRQCESSISLSNTCFMWEYDLRTGLAG